MMNEFTRKKYQKLRGHFNQLEAVRSKNEKLFSLGQLVNRDISQLYRGLFLDAYVSFESFLEDIFLGLLQKENCVGHAANPILNIKSSQIARKVLFRDKKYIDWLPYTRTEESAKIFFARNGHPFTSSERISTSDRFFMNEELPVVRNVLSHDSRHAKKRFNELLDKKYILLNTSEKIPVNFIRHTYKRSPDTTLFEEYIDNILRISYSLAK